MFRTGVVLCILFLFACNNKNSNSGKEETSGFSYESFSQKFRKGTLPYQLTDTALSNNRDTAAIRNTAFAQFIPDSIKRTLFGAGSKPKYIPIAMFDPGDAEKYFLLKAVNGGKKAAVLVVFDQKNDRPAVMTFLLPDADPATTQTSSIDKSLSVTRAVSRKMKNDVTADGKEVFIYNEALHNFTLIMTDVLDESSMALINPIDTFPRRSKFAGDYTNGNRNLVSVRDAKSASEISFYIHFEREDDCTGELKGTATMTSGNTAVFRQGGDPCVLELSFSGRTVTLHEVEGCGSHRSVRCFFEGTFTKKAVKKKTPARSKRK